MNREDLIETELEAAGLTTTGNNMPTRDEMDTAKEKAKEKWLAILIINNPRRIRYAGLRTKLTDPNVMSIDNYPTTIAEAMRMINDYEDLHRVYVSDIIGNLPVYILYVTFYIIASKNPPLVAATIFFNVLNMVIGT